MSIWDRLFGKKKSEEMPPSDKKQTALQNDKSKLKGQPLQPSHHSSISSADKSGSQQSKDRVVRVFVSSTFRDMIEDRNELMSQVWPPLQKLCRARSVEFVEVDLRWGITVEQSERKETLRYCLAEIKRCRPYFIGLLGERYGWVPEADAYSQAVLDEESWLWNEVAKRSVTELEIMHGVLNDPDMARRAFFYFRDPEYAKAHGKDFLPENDQDKDHQIALREQVKSVCREKNIPLHEDYADPKVLSELVLSDLTAAIKAEFPPDQVPDVWAREDRDHEAYARSRRTEFYVGRDEYFKSLDDYTRSGAEGMGMTVLGESGGGKSALLANWADKWKKKNPDDFVFQHYIGSSPISASHLFLMRRLMVSILRFCENDAASLRFEEERIPAKADEIAKVFPEYLDRLALKAKEKGVRAVIMLDALNQLEDRERGRLLSWLPYRMPPDVRLVVSTLPGDTLNALSPRGWLPLNVEPLTPEERKELIARHLSHFSKALSVERAENIAGASASSNPLFIKTLLDDLRATGAHERLDAQIVDYLKSPDIPSLFGKILSRYEGEYERERPGLVRDALSFIWAARRGLTEPELLQVLKPEGKKALPAAFWSPLRCALLDGLVDHDGVLAFSHQHLRDAVKERYVPDDRTAMKLRSKLSDLFAAQSVDARQADELPWLLWKIEARDRLRSCLLDIDRFLLIQKRDELELLGYWVWMKEERTMGGLYVTAFERWAEDKGETGDVSYTASMVSFFLSFSASLYADSEPLMRRALKIDEQSYGKNHPTVAICLNNLAALLKATNRLADAEPLMRRALSIDEQSYGKNHPTVARDLNNLAQLLQATNRLADAELLMHRALSIDEQSYGKNHPDVARNLNNLALLLQATNRLADAEPLMRRALSIDEQSYGKNHPTVATHLNNLAFLLQATNRLADAEPLMRRMLEIFLQFTHDTGHQHPHLQAAIENYACLLQTMGKSDVDIRNMIEEMGRRFGVDLSG